MLGLQSALWGCAVEAVPCRAMQVAIQEMAS